MSTTSIRLPDELKRRLTQAAKESGQTPHGFIVEAIELRTAQAEARRDFVREARERADEIERTGMAVPWDDARAYLLARAAGKRPARPRARKVRG
jgi:predicted transcriptional regulator